MFRSGLLIDRGEILFQDVGHLFDLAIEVTDENGSAKHYAADGLRNFRFAATGHGAGLMTKRRVGPRCDKTPSGPAGLFFKANLRAPRQYVCNTRAQDQLVCLPARQLPSHGALPNTELSVLGNVEDV